MNAPTPVEQQEKRERPKSLTDLFISFTLLALQGFGGVLAIVQHELVDRKRWLTKAEFIEDWAVAQIMPGPNVVNICIMIGSRYFGLRGAVVAVAGVLVCPLIVLLLFALTYAHFADNPGVAGALRGMGAVASGLLIASGLKLMSALKSNPLGVVWCATLALLTFVAIALIHLPLSWVLIPLGIVAYVVTYRRLKP
jgi:chromate transporter